MAMHMPVLYALGLLGLLLAANATDLRLQQVDRKINLSSQFSRVSETIKVKNTGSQTGDRVILCTLAKLAENRAYYKVMEIKGSKVELKYKPVQVADQPEAVSCVEVMLSAPLPAGETATLESLAVYHSVQTPYPAEVQQTDPQLMVYVDNLHVVSPYQVSGQTTEVVLPTSNIKSFTEEKPTAKSDSKIKYGRYDSIKPFSLKELKVHFEQNKAFKQVLSCEREIQVSHWGNIYVEESYVIKNGGAKHVGAFSRLKFAHNYNGKGNSFRDLRARFPLSAHSLYYVDLIGNISSSNTRRTSSETILDLELRYPLMGGWKEDFMIGYSLPLKGFVFKTRSGNKLVLDFSPSIDDLHVTDLTVKVVLPEGSSAIAASLPYDVDRSFDTKYTYLDVTGRPVLVLKKQNVVPEHATKLEVQYHVNPLSILFEPCLLIAAFFVFFVTIIAINRMEFTISKDDRWKEAKNKEKVTGSVQELNTLVTDNSDLLREVEAVVDKLTDASEVEAVLKEKNLLEGKMKELDAKIGQVLLKVESYAPRVGLQAKEIVEKAKVLRVKHVKAVTDKADMLKKGMSIQEVEKKLLVTKKQLAEAKAEFSDAADTFFTPY